FTENGSCAQTGTLIVQATGTLILAGSFANFDGSTLTDGTYVISGTLEFTDADIQALAATLVLDGQSAEIVDLTSGLGGLRDFAAIGAAGSCTIQAGYDVAVGDFTNNGVLVIGPDSTFTANGDYSQTGTANVQAMGTLSLQGGGTSNGPISNDGTMFVGGNFTQHGTFNQTG